jgi:LytS/YehU family sensor histidine kinase
MAVFGGLVVALIIGLIATVFGWGFGTASDNPFLYWLIATGTPAGTLAVLYFACWKTQSFKKGVLIGLCVWTLVAGLCNAGMSSGFKEVPRLSH